MASSNERRRKVARAKYERQQARRSTRARRRRLLRRIALVIAIVALVVLIVLGLYWIFVANDPDLAAATAVAAAGRTASPSSDLGSTW